MADQKAVLVSEIASQMALNASAEGRPWSRMLMSPGLTIGKVAELPLVEVVAVVTSTGSDDFEVEAWLEKDEEVEMADFLAKVFLLLLSRSILELSLMTNEQNCCKTKRDYSLKTTWAREVSQRQSLQTFIVFVWSTLQQASELKWTCIAGEKKLV